LCLDRYTRAGQRCWSPYPNSLGPCSLATRCLFRRPIAERAHLRCEM